MNTQHTLLLRLIGPMQSWGHRSRFDDRDTALEPTRSGVIGLLCAAMGIPREQDLSRFDSLRMGVRVDAPGRVMTDYHTALDVIKADGSGRDTVQSRRHFLTDARFTAGLESNDLELLREIEAKLGDPVWPLYLGRKSFPLTEPPLLPGGSILDNKTLEDALREAPWWRMWRYEREPQEPVRALLEDSEGKIAQTDWPLHFGERRFSLRRMTTVWISTPIPVEDLPCCI